MMSSIPTNDSVAMATINLTHGRTLFQIVGVPNDENALSCSNEARRGQSTVISNKFCSLAIGKRASIYSLSSLLSGPQGHCIWPACNSHDTDVFHENDCLYAYIQAFYQERSSLIVRQRAHLRQQMVQRAAVINAGSYA